MFQVSEIVAILMALALTPVMYSAVRRLSFAGKPAMALGAVFMILSYTFTVLETVVLSDALNLLEHACLAASAVAFAVGVVQLSRAERRTGDAE